MNTNHTRSLLLMIRNNLEIHHCLATNNGWSWSWFNRFCSSSESSMKLMPSCKVSQLARVRLDSGGLMWPHFQGQTQSRLNQNDASNAKSMVVFSLRMWWQSLTWKLDNMMGRKHQFDFFSVSESNEIKLNAKMHQLNLIDIRRRAPCPRILV